jgi:hypothetical protein
MSTDKTDDTDERRKINKEAENPGKEMGKREGVNRLIEASPKIFVQVYS